MALSTDRQARIYVCSLDALEDVVATSGASHILTVINPWSLPQTPDSIKSENHLKVAANDIEEEQSGLIAPNPSHIVEILQFVDRWDRQQPLVIHCLAGISRSTAAAFISLCAINPETDEMTLAECLRQASDSAWPNRLMVRLADRHMNRNGRMIAAIENIGEGDMGLEANPFSVPSLIARKLP